MWVDSHCHLTYEEDAPHLDTILARAKKNDVGACVSIGCRVDEFERLKQIADTQDNVFFSIGIHPHEAEETLKTHSLTTLKNVMREALHHPKAIGVGETGLDYYYEHSPRALQQDVFAMQLELALEESLPVIIHTRDADEDTVRILKDVGQTRVRGDLHCFSGTRALYEAGLELGFYISASGIVTFPKAQELREIFKDVPLDRLLVETDAPYLAPVPHRGKRNEPGFVVHTAEALSQLRGESMDVLQCATTQNFLTLFSKARPFFPDHK